MNINSKLFAALTLAVALLVGGPAFAFGGHGGGGGGGFHGGGGGGHGAVFSGGGYHGGSAAAGSYAYSRGAGRRFGAPTIAFGGGSYNSRSYTNSRGGNRNYTYAFGSHDGWNHGRDYLWRGHRYHWYNNGWFIVDPYPYDAGYPYYGDYGSDYTDYAPAADYNSSGSNSANAPVSVQVQKELARTGYYRGPINGIVGPGTQAAISAYQRDNGLHVTGTINSHLLDALDLD